ncbi:hypothetical protein [Streptomyces sp. NK15101]|uniref:hypothetical protein n=1 Tax=Streptomyces sp. NK15101 TaxID=2873261 RepID=UPI0027E0FAC3|nr:hypothetical protein [Streptomyces sp. NK15101]
MTIEWGGPRRLGVPASEAGLRFETEKREAGDGPGRRLLVVDGEPAFELSFWCGTCPFLFCRLEDARQTLSLGSVQERLTGALADPDEGGVIDAFGALLPEGEYLPALLRVEPRLVVPGREDDYFSGEQVATWGLDDFWDLPQYPRTPYYRTFEAPVDASAHLYEFVVPMVPRRGTRGSAWRNTSDSWPGVRFRRLSRSRRRTCANPPPAGPPITTGTGA